jgi:hypothetical protein
MAEATHTCTVKERQCLIKKLLKTIAKDCLGKRATQRSGQVGNAVKKITFSRRFTMGDVFYAATVTPP